jgi:hypothetical protein
MNLKLSKIKKLELRKVWNNEARDFTNWLAQEDSLDQLGNEIGIDITLLKTEASVGKYNVDILAEEETSRRKIIIENQLEDTNHDHLGKIITYASGYDAKIIIWIVKDVREEHHKAIEWLNEHTDEEISFFLIKIELLQIGDSDPAPQFEILASPNEWAKTIKSTQSNGELTETKLLQLEFWKEFKSFIQKKDSSIRLKSPSPRNWYNISIGSRSVSISLSTSIRTNTISCELYFDDNKELFNLLLNNKSEIESFSGEEFEWVNMKKDSRMRLTKEAQNYFSVDNYDENFQWFYEKIIILRKVYNKFIKGLKK